MFENRFDLKSRGGFFVFGFSLARAVVLGKPPGKRVAMISQQGYLKNIFPDMQKSFSKKFWANKVDSGACIASIPLVNWTFVEIENGYARGRVGC